MKITGSQNLPLTVERAYEALRDPALLAKCMPGCEGLELIGPDEYKMKMKMARAAFSGLFDGKIRITDSNPPTSFRLIVEGSGKVGFMKGEGLLKHRTGAPFGLQTKDRSAQAAYQKRAENVRNR